MSLMKTAKSYSKGSQKGAHRDTYGEASREV
jgi:hypothetical protein